MRPIAAILLSAFLLAILHGQMARADWLNDLLSGVNAQVDQINRNVNDQVARINQDVNAEVTRVNQNVREQLARAEEEIKEAEKNAKPGDGSSRYFVNHGSSVVVNGNGNYRTVHSGTDSDGKPYWIQIEERIKDGVLRHSERIYNYTTNSYQDYVIERKLSDPGAEPIFNNFTATKQPST